ncbi:MAG TPA: BamA/TamA family outer membrane protein [Thermoanaerobaculia bacterium]
MRKVVRILLVFTFTLALMPAAEAQYFGRNKVQWQKFHFKVLQTQHFDIYYYDEEADVVNDIGRMAERWYARLSTTFNHTFTRKPIVLYANAADFQQTTTTGEIIGEGTGGFTDEFMNRVVLPLTGDYAENDHVLGHEIVHVFQYDIAASQNTSRRRFSLEQLPLWLVEGMAEYFSKGRIDPLTSMWVRDATLHNRLPDLRKLTTDPRYFPYRYGEALLAYIGGRFGDEAVVRYFLAAGLVGIEPAFDRTLGLSAKQVFADWQEASRELYNPVIALRPSRLGAPLLGKLGTKADLNLGPALSPDGNYIAFLSTRDLFDIDLFLADAHTGKIIRRLVSATTDAHFDALRFIDSAGTWSPDSQRLAVVLFEKGDNYLGIVDVGSRRVDQIRVPGIDAITNIAWSPAGNVIAISGQKTGVTDLFLYNLDTKAVRQLTDDKYADMQPAWSPDGKQIAFVTDRGAGADPALLHFGDMTIATIDLDGGQVHLLPLFSNTRHISPQYAPDGRSLYFIANPEGVPDVYRYTFASNTIEKITNVMTGVAGITEMSPALSVANRTGQIAFSLYEDDDYNIYQLQPAPQGTVVSATQSPAPNETARAAVLPPLRATGSEITSYLNKPSEGLLPATTVFHETNYKPGLHVAYIGPPTIGAGVSQFGVGVGGSVSAYYTDILGEQNVGFTLLGTGTGVGTIADQIGGEVFYLNQQHRFNWGADVTHIPYVSLTPGFRQDFVNGQLADIYQEFQLTETVDDGSLLAQYPLTSTRRFEVSGGIERYALKAELEELAVVGNTVISDTRTRLPGGFSVSLLKTSAAFVGDSSVFGFVSPVRGTRYRYEADAMSGDLRFETALADYRHYFFFRPMTLAVRALHYGRYGRDSDNFNILSPIDLGYSYLVRGYDSVSLGECVATPADPCPVYDRLVGSRIAATSIELRAPLLGTKEYGLINAPAVPTEMEAFVDAGEAWTAHQTPKFNFKRDATSTLVPVVSVGVGLRILLSYIPIEIYAAKPFQRPQKNIVYGFNITPGW